VSSFPSVVILGPFLLTVKGDFAALQAILKACVHFSLRSCLPNSWYEDCHHNLATMTKSI